MKLKIPYRFRLISPIIGWAIICFVFNIVLVLNTVLFEPNTKGIFMLMSLAYFSIVLIITAFAVIPIRPFRSEVSSILEKNIKNGKLITGVDNIEIAKVFQALCDYPKKCLKNSFLIGGIYLVLVLIWCLIFLKDQFNIYILSMIEIITVTLIIGFSIFWPQFQSFEVIKQCRNVLILKDLKLAEVYSSSISMKLFFVFFYFLDVMMLYILSTLCEAQIGGIIFFSGIVMVIFISVILLLYFYNSLNDFIDSIRKVSKDELTVFSTGSLDKEFVDLSKNLNEISIKLYASKQEAIASKKEMEKRVQELERFFELTVSREEKMIELKKENDELRDKLLKKKK
ncbi:hypothetical protein M0R01_02780 [bacterium]|nr:hypothetical protein [bacterium]